MFKLALTAGHYMGTPGKRCLVNLDPNSTREWWLNDRVADKIEKMLSEYQDVLILRTDDTTGKKDISLNTRIKEANNFDPDFYLSIHHNAGIKGGRGGGIVAFVQAKPSSTELLWQDELYDELIRLTGLKGNRSNPIPRKNYAEVKKTKAPAVLLELGFMDSQVDVPIILSEDYATKCAQACVNVIVARAKLKKKVAVQPTPTPAPNKVKNLKLGMKGEDVRRMQQLLNLLGYDCGDADGSFGTATEKGVKAFQTAMKITSDGIFGTTSFNTLKRCLTNFKSVFKRGMKGEKIVALQSILMTYGLYSGKLDGSFGPATEAAVKAYQKPRGLAQDGKAGPKTIASLVDYLAL